MNFALNYVYLLHNLTLTPEDVKSLTKLEVMNIISIYSKLLDSFKTDNIYLHNQFLTEMTQSLAEMSNLANMAMIVSGLDCNCSSEMILKMMC